MDSKQSKNFVTTEILTMKNNATETALYQHSDGSVQAGASQLKVLVLRFVGILSLQMARNVMMGTQKMKTGVLLDAK